MKLLPFRRPLQMVVQQELLNEVYMGHEHAPAAVSAQPQRVQRSTALDQDPQRVARLDRCTAGSKPSPDLNFTTAFTIRSSPPAVDPGSFPTYGQSPAEQGSGQQHDQHFGQACDESHLATGETPDRDDHFGGPTARSGYLKIATFRAISDNSMHCASHDWSVISEFGSRLLWKTVC